MAKEEMREPRCDRPEGSADRVYSIRAPSGIAFADRRPADSIRRIESGVSRISNRNPRALCSVRPLQQRTSPVRVETVVTLIVNAAGFALFGAAALLVATILFP
jgi:hypothetical protein